MNSTVAHFTSLSLPAKLQLSSPRQQQQQCCLRSLRNMSSLRIKSSLTQYNIKNNNIVVSDTKSRVIKTLKNIAATTVLLSATLSLSPFARANPQKPHAATTTTEQKQSNLSEFLETNDKAIDALKALLQQKLENHENEEALKLVKRLVEAQPEEIEWRFLMAKLIGEMGERDNARKVYDEILQREPLHYDALFENALLMDKCGEGERVIGRLEEALRLAELERKQKEVRDVRLIMAQMRFLQKDVEGALRDYKKLEKEDPRDFRPYFCLGMIYSLIDRNDEAREQFRKYRELSPKKFEVEGFVRTPLSRMKLFRTDEGEGTV